MIIMYLCGGDFLRILNFGSCNIDYVYSLDHITSSGETENTYNLSTFAGGKGLNQSIAVSRAGGKVFHAGCIGENGEFLQDLLKENGVDTTNIKTVSEKNGHAIIQVDKNGGNAIFLFAGSNAMISREHIDKTLQKFSKGDILMLQNEINNLDYLIEKAYEKDMTIVLNPSPINEKIAEVDLNKISYLVLNEIEAFAFSSCNGVNNALAFFKENYPKLKVMLTLGEKGCIYQDENQQAFHPIFKVEAVDTTAAGDTFTGYFVVGIAEGMDINKVLKYASCASAISVTKKGAAPSIPYIKQVLEQLTILKTDKADIKEKNTHSKIEEYIDNNLITASIKGLAQYLGYSEIYSGMLVKKVAGVTYKELLHKKRLEKAAELLLKTELSVSEIIKTVGYENQSYFRKIFKERYGKMPLQYRKNGVK